MDLDDALDVDAGPLVEFVDVLGDQCVQRAALLERHQGAVSIVRLDLGPERPVCAASPVASPNRWVGHIRVDV
jgi:hypothetical protein